MYFILATFSGVLGTFEAGTERSFTDSTAMLLRNGGLITPVGSDAHKAWLAANAPAEAVSAADTASEAETATDPQPALETKPQPDAEPALETKPAPAPAKTTRTRAK